MKNTATAIGLALALAFTAAYAQENTFIAPACREQAQRILKETGVTGGLVVHVGCGQDPALTLALRANDSFVVQGLESDPEKVSRVRKIVQDAGAYGPVSVISWSGGALPYVDNLVRLLVIEDGTNLSRAEIERVLSPGGWAYSLQPSSLIPQSFQKPWPKQMDVWTQHLHSPNNNAVSQDKLVGQPRGMQWVADPEWSRFGSLATSMDLFVSDKGRIFHTQDMAPSFSAFFPDDWWLVARDAFSGLELWRRPLGEWRDFMIYKKNFPTMIHRRAAVLGGDLFVTLALDDPVSLLDAVTGETRHVFEETRGAEEMLVSDNILLVAATDEKTYYRGQIYGLKEPQPRRIVAIDRKTRKPLWQKTGSVTAMSLTMTPEKVYYHDGVHVRALDTRTGEELWLSEDALPLPNRIPSWYGLTLVAVKNRVLITVGPEDLGKLWETTGIDDLHALDAETGKTVWKAKHYPSGYKSPKDIFVINDQVWFGDHAVGYVWKNRPEAGPPTTWKAFAHDLETGEKLREIEPNVQFDHAHNRCHRGKATVNYMLTAVRGIDLLDLEKGTWIKNNWVRGQCNIGFTPANGLVYFPPHACTCFTESLIKGFNALGATSALAGGEDQAQSRLSRGPAYAEAIEPTEAQSDDWPVYRGDALRSGHRPTVLAGELQPAWTAALEGELTAPTIADGRVYVGLKNSGVIQALDGATGQALWRFDLDGGIDTPPTYAGGRLYAGSRDGQVYCLRADSGRLIWRFRAAPNNRQLVARGQLESVWPLNGSALVLGDTVYVLAGRSIHLDGGLRLLRLQTETGELLGETVLEGTDPETGQPLDDKSVVGNPDLLVSDGKHLACRGRVFDLQGKETSGQHFDRPFAGNGFLDHNYFNRLLWKFGSNPGQPVFKGIPYGNLLVVDDASVFGFGSKATHTYNSLARKDRIFGSSRHPETSGKGRLLAFKPDWEIDSPIIAMAMVKTKTALVVLGTDNALDEGKPTPSHINLERRQSLSEEAERTLENFQGKHGSRLLILDPENGELKQDLRLPVTPVWDGLAAANGKLYVSLKNGEIICLKSSK